jgi:hypothetical protein
MERGGVGTGGMIVLIEPPAVVAVVVVLVVHLAVARPDRQTDTGTRVQRVRRVSDSTR